MGRLGRGVVMSSLCLAVVGYTVVPAGGTRDLAYQLIGLLAVAAGFWGLRHNSTPRGGWLLVLSGFLGWVVGDAVYSAQVHLLDLDAYPGPSDAIYLASYAVIGAGLVRMVRRRGERGDLTALLDATILATGFAVVVGVFLVAPIADDSTLSVLGKLTSTAYPVADVLLLGILVRLWATPGARTTAFRLLTAALSVTLVGDVVYNVTSIHGSSVGTSVVNDLLWLAGYVLVAGAAWSPSAHDLTEPVPGLEELSDPRRRLLVLTSGLLLPGVALLIDGLTGDSVAWEVIVAGIGVLSVLVVSRMAGLLNVVRVQAVQLAALARVDPLTGIPNRRTWDHELSRACGIAREESAPLTVALLDLDHFKRYNDAHGHPAGDLLLREATAAWSGLLAPDQVLARYGGEEFAILFPGAWAADVRPVIDRMRALTPSGQTFSAGVATWDPDTDPMVVVAAADRALYAAKRAGRDRITLAPRPLSTSLLPRPTMVFQAIVDLRTAAPVGVEALSRFEHEQPLAVFDEATRIGSGPTLEALAITYALSNRPRGLWVAVNVSLDSLVRPQVRQALDGDLTGVVLEVTEHTDSAAPDLREAVAGYRARGARIAIDDWGRGFSDLDRLRLLQPEIVKLDMSLVHGLEHDHHRAAVRSVVTWAEHVGAQVCAEGIETEDQWQTLRAFGVHLGQGHFFGVPSATPPSPLGAATSGG